jgi:hypothetical protein
VHNVQHTVHHALAVLNALNAIQDSKSVVKDVIRYVEMGKNSSYRAMMEILLMEMVAHLIVKYNRTMFAMEVILKDQIFARSLLLTMF